MERSSAAKLGKGAHHPGVALRLIAPGKPIQNTYVERISGGLRDECLNEHWFANLMHAGAVIEPWRREMQSRKTQESLGRADARGLC